MFEFVCLSVEKIRVPCQTWRPHDQIYC